MKLSLLASSIWWKDASRRALYTAIAIALPYLGASLIADVPWLTVLSAALVGFISSLATSLAGLPETVGVDLPWWLAALERVVKTFFQGLAAGLVGAVLVTDVDWLFILQASLLSAATSLLRLILATLPNDPSPQLASVAYVGRAEVHEITAVQAPADVQWIDGDGELHTVNPGPKG